MKPLRTWRQERLMSTRSLAKAAAISDKTLIQIELGRQRPQWRTMRALCDALSVQPREVTEFAAVLDSAQGEDEAAA